MLNAPILRGIFLSALSLTGFLLLYIYFSIYPPYRELLIDHAEDEAVRYVTFLVHAYDLAHLPIVENAIPDEIGRDVGRFSLDEPLIKLRVFDSRGKIVYSTIPREIGDVNEHDYFHVSVASGQVYSKTVQKDNLTAEMEVVRTDLVETYVPIMVGETFRGAVETYYDVSRSTQAINRLTNHSLLSLAVGSFLLLCLLYYALRHADQALTARLEAEEGLRRSNEELETRVARRTVDLERLNENLNEEITEKSRVQNALSIALSESVDARERMDGIIRSVADGILVVDREEEIVTMNRPAELILGCSLSSGTGKSIHEIKMPENLKSALEKLLFRSESAHIDFELARAAPERPRVFQARSSVLRDRDGMPHGTVILLHDVTIARDIDRMKSDFVAMAAHELMTPLASIMGYSELLDSETAKSLSEEQRAEFVRYIHSKSEGLSRIVDNLLDISRLEAGHEIALAKIEFDICVIIERLIDAYRKGSPGHTFVFEQEPRACKIFADPGRIEQVLENLLSNAVKYSPDGGEIRLRCSCENGFYRYTFIDQGLGMTAEQLEHIFDKFYRVDVSDTARPGVGLGMSIVKHIVEAHGGTIRIDSEAGKGTEVTLSLPAVLPGETEDKK